MNAAPASNPAALPAHPAFAESAASLTEMLRGFVIRWETLDLASASCIGADACAQAWAADAEALLLAAYERQ